METKETIGNFQFESRESYDRAKKEEEIILQLHEKADLSDGKTALKIYNKLVADKVFSTVIGCCFLSQLRQYISESGVAAPDMLPGIPVQEVEKKQQDTMPARPPHGDRYQRMYEGQRLLNKKYKIAIAALLLILAGFILINFKFEYSIFTYFTNYKANMEEELIDKYEDWESELEEREKKLNESGKE